MDSRRILSLLLALLMTFSTVAELIPATVFASEVETSTESTETPSTSLGSYEISMDEVIFAEDGSLIISIPEGPSTETQPVETEPEATEAEVTEPEATEPEATEAEVTEPEATEPEATEAEVTEPEVTEPVATEAEVTEPEVTEPEETEPEETIVVMTWFQWAQEKGVDVSNLSKEAWETLFTEYGAYRINTLAEMGELPEGAASGTVANNYIEIAVQDDGHFSIGNRIGNPDYSTDDNKILLYGHPYGSTSETLITIDGVYENYFYADTTTYSYNAATSTMNIPEYNIKVTQTLKLVKSGSGSFEDTVQIEYKVQNNSNVQHDVGIRIMMDTMLAYNDHATFRVAAVGHITTGRVFTGSSVPSVYQVYDDLNNPTTLATGHLYKSGDRKPDKVQFCNWGGIRGSRWNHQVTNGDYLGDSAVGIYFNPVSIKSGKSTTVRTYYGVSIGSSSGNSDEVSGNEVKLVIKDSYTREPIGNVKVEYRKELDSAVQTVYTGDDGVAILPNWSGDGALSAAIPVSLILSKDGYTRSTISTSFRAGTTVTYQMSSKDNEIPVINSIVLKSGSKNTDLLTGTYTLDEDVYDHVAENGSTGTVTIKATADMADCTWLLVEDEKVLQKNSTGEFVLNIREEGEGSDKKTLVEGLSPDGYRYIQCISPSGKKSDKMRFGLKVRAGDKVEFFPLSLGEIMPEGSSPLTEGTLAALFLGNKFSFGLNKNSSLKFQVELVDGGGVRVGLNFTAKEWDDMNEKLDCGKTGKELVEGLQDEMMDYLRSAKNKKFSNKAEQLVAFSVGNAKAELVFCGYGEGKLENGKVRIDLTAFVALKGEASYTTQFLVVSVPVYIQVGAEAEAKLQGSANLVNSEGVQFAFYDATFTPSVGVWLEGGAGVKGAVSVGAQGKGTISLICDLVNRSQRAEFVAQANLVAEAFVWEKEIPLGEKRVVLYDSNDKEGTAYGGDENIFQMLEEQPFKLVTREQMSGENADGGTSGSAAKVQMLNVDGTQYKFFLADRGGDQSNRYMLSYSKLVNGGWTESVPVADDGTLDTYYDVATDGTNIYVVWSNSSKRFNDATVTIDEMFAAQEIYFTTILADGTIEEPVRLTNDSAMDILPAVTTVSETAYVAWYHTENGIENNTDIADHYLYYTSVVCNTAGTITKLNCGDAAISSISASAAGFVPVATFVSNASTAYEMADNTTTVVDMSNGTLNTVDTSNKIIGKAVSGVIDGDEKIFWMENGNVAYADSLTSQNPTYIFGENAIPGSISTDNYTVLTVDGTTYLIWTQSGADEYTPAVAMTSVYSSGIWSEAHKLTELSIGNITELDGYLNADGQLVLVYTAKSITGNEVVGVNVTTSTLEKVVEPEQSIQILDLEYEVTDAIPGQALPMTLTLVNTGNTAIDSLDLNIQSNIGEHYTYQLTNLNIAPGTAAEVEITEFVLSSSLTTRTVEQGQYQYTMTVNATGSAVMAQETFEIGYDNVVLYKRDMAMVDNRENIIIAVENQSGFPASNVHVRILADAIDGVLIYDNVFETIPQNGQVVIYVDVDDLNSSSLFATVTSDCDASAEAEYVELMVNNNVTEATLRVETFGGGTANPEYPVDVPVGESVYLSATPYSGYVFDGWYSHRELVFLYGDENSPNAEIQMPAGNTTVTARFASLTPYDFTLNSESAEIYVGDTYQLSGVFASELGTSKLSWSSSNESVATVSGRGLVTGLSEGTAVITASCGEYVHSCQVTVRYVDVTTIQMVYPQLALEPAGTAVLEVLTYPVNGESSLIWSSSNENVVRVNEQGVVTAVGYGTAVVTATARTNSAVFAQSTVRVIKAVEDIYLSENDLILGQGAQEQIYVSFAPDEANYGKEIIWSVDNPGVVELTPSGEFHEKLTITAVGGGNVTITARTENGCEASCVVDIIDAGDIQIETYDVEYTGKALTPYFSVFFRSRELEPDVDYTLKYSNNKNVGSATVKFTGKGMFAGITTETTFHINPSYARLDATVVTVKNAPAIKLTWNASQGAGGYLLCRSVDYESMDLYQTLSSSAKSYTDTEVSSDHVYNYLLIPYKDVKKNGETIRYVGYTSEVSEITAMGPVKNLVAVTTQEDNVISLPYQVTLTWDHLEGAESYIIYMEREEGNSEYYCTTSSNIYTLELYEPGKIQFKVVPTTYVRGNLAKGASSNVVSVYGVYTPVLSAYQGAKSVEVYYDSRYYEADGGIELYRSTDGVKWSKFKTINFAQGYCEDTIVDSSAKSSGVYYQYIARTFVKDGGKTYYGPYSDLTATMCLGTPSISAVKTAVNDVGENVGLEITWKKVAGADSYTITRYSSRDGDTTFTYTVPAGSKASTFTYTDATATEPGLYDYSIQACAVKDGVTYSGSFSDYKYGYVLQSPTLYYVGNTQKGVETYWDWGSDADGFEVWRSANNGKTWSKVKALSSNYLHDTGASKNGTTYSYKVRAYTKANGVTYYSNFSDVLSISKMAAPKIKSVVALESGGYEITFHAVADANFYNIYRGTDDSHEALSTIFSTGEKTYTVTDPNATGENRLYYYSIEAYRSEQLDENGAVVVPYGAAGTYVYTYHFGQPQVTLENAEKGIMVYANVQDIFDETYGYAGQYTIYRSEDGGKWKKLKTVDADNYGRLVYQDTSATNEKKTYSYKVEAFNQALNAYTMKQSEPVSINYKPGPKQNALVNAYEGITVSWSAQKKTPEVVYYEIYRSNDGYSFSYVGSVDGETFTFTDTSVTGSWEGYWEENFYSYKVKAIPVDETQPVTYSAIQAIFRMDAPVYVTAENMDEKSARINWDWYGPVDGFEIRYTTGTTTKIVKPKDAWGWYQLSGLKTDARYEISVRSYITLNKVKYYSDWSNPCVLRR